MLFPVKHQRIFRLMRLSLKAFQVARNGILRFAALNAHVKSLKALVPETKAIETGQLRSTVNDFEAGQLRTVCNIVQ